jgi:uncharacterized protein (DUF3820 family)
MSKYIINNEPFANKEQIINKCRDILSANNGKNMICGKELEFLLALFQFHPCKDDKLKNLKRVFVGIDLFETNLCFWLENNKGFIDDISFHSCVTNIPFGENQKINLKIPFGKYKGQSIYEVNDNDYLEWMYNLPDLDRGTKVKIGQFLRFGFIPFNPIAHRAEMKKYAKRRS